MDEKKIDEIFKPKKLFVRNAIIMFLISLIMYAWFFIGNLQWQKRSEGVNYYELIENKADIENIRVQVKITDITKFTDEEKYNYYYLTDEEGNILIANLDEETENKIIEEYNNEKEKFSYDLDGYLFEIAEPRKQQVISQLKKSFADAPTITEENYEKYFGKTYVSITIPAILIIYRFGMIFGFLLDLLALYFLMLYFLSGICMKKYLKNFNLEELKNELRKDSTKVFEKEHVYLTASYIIYAYSDILDITKYQELFWMYSSKSNATKTIDIVGRVTNQRYTSILLGDCQDQDKVKEIMDLIKEKNSDVLVGYSKENKKAYKNYWKKIKLRR